MPKGSKKAETTIRDFAMSYPGAHEDFPWGERAIKVNGKAFVFMSNGGELGFSVKLPQSKGEALNGYDFTEPTHYGLGKHGWVSASFGDGAEVPFDVVRDWIDESYRAVAPKTMVKKLDAGSAPETKPAKKKKAAVKK